MDDTKDLMTRFIYWNHDLQMIEVVVNGEVMSRHKSMSNALEDARKFRDGGKGYYEWRRGHSR